MIRRRNFTVFVAFLFFLSACATAPTHEEISRIGYGEPLAVDYHRVINDYFNETLFDPYSAKIDIGTPDTGSIRTSLIEGREVIAGYFVPVKVNAKNRYGAYVGNKDYLFIFRNDQLVKILNPEDLALTRWK